MATSWQLQQRIALRVPESIAEMIEESSEFS
jgi:hypothetical protein